MLSRSQIIWVIGNAPSDFVSAATERRMQVQNLKTPTDFEYTASGSAIFEIKKYNGSIAKLLDTELAKCLNHGVTPIILGPSKAVLIVQGRFLDYGNRIEFFDYSKSWSQLAERARDGSNAAGRSLNADLIVTGLCPEEDRLLLRRAFNDFASIELSALTEGKSSAKVYCVHARHDGDAGNAFMLPFFAKIDRVKEIQQELYNFQSFVQDNVPFSQRPNLNGGRSIMGAERGILVGDFVDDARSLAGMCSRPEARAIIYSVFDDALRSWRRHSFAHQKSDVLSFTADLMPELVRHTEIDSEIVNIARRRFKLKATPDELASRLKDASRHNYRCGTIHGDLHPGNIMARGSEAILIDFLSIKSSAPLIADLACLEIASCFTVAAEEVTAGRQKVKRDAFKSWRAEIDELFSRECLRNVRPLQQTPSSHSWMWNACRQTRGMALQLDAVGSPYACALVAYLMRRARLGSRAPENLVVAAYALKVAERILICVENDLATV